MFKWIKHSYPWLPALLMMLVIYWFSAQPPDELPVFDWADTLIKKGGHVIGYALLALSYWRAFDFDPRKRWIAWSLAVLYAVTDEFHQSFVSERHPSPWDVLIFDNLGALASIGLADFYRKQKRPDLTRPVVEEADH